MKERNIKIIIEYDGSNYGGWQRQSNAPSIQQAIEEGLLKLTGEKIVLKGAGRTDAKVHAKGQVANFVTRSSTIPADRFSFALNTAIPYDIRILKSYEVSHNFDSRFCARARHYRYSVINRPSRIAIGRNYYCHIPEELDKEAMERGLNLLKGTHDFKAFQASGSPSKTTVRTIYDARIWGAGSYLHFDIIGNGFLYNMMRIIVGTLVEIGKGKMDENELKKIISSRDRRLAGRTMPAQGLCLEKVHYSTETGDFVLDTLDTMY